MLRLLIGPRWLLRHATLVVVLGATLLLGLWQLDHFEQHVRSHADSPVAALDTVTRPGGRLNADDVARRITAVGVYDADRTLLVPGRERDGRRGLLVVTPLRTQAGVLPVLRGWVPSRSSPAVRPPPGGVILRGRVQPSEESDASGVDPLAALPRSQVPYVATVTLLDAWPYPAGALYDGYVVASAEQPSAGPVPARVVAVRPSGGVARWRNLAYAVQWWLFGLAAFAFWVSLVRRDLSERPTGRRRAPGSLRRRRRHARRGSRGARRRTT